MRRPIPVTVNHGHQAGQTFGMRTREGLAWIIPRQMNLTEPEPARFKIGAFHADHSPDDAAKRSSSARGARPDPAEGRPDRAPPAADRRPLPGHGLSRR